MAYNGDGQPELNDSVGFAFHDNPGANAEDILPGQNQCPGSSPLQASTPAAGRQQCWRCNIEFSAGASICPACGLVMGRADALSASPEMSLLERLSTRYASFWRRFAAYVCDLGILAVASNGLGFMIGLVLPILGVTITQAGPTPHIVVFILLLVLCWLYFAVFESSERQATPGKVLLGIRVTDEDGARLPFFFTSVRFFAKLLAGPLLVGFLMAAITERRQALHDLAAGSLVVRG